MSIQKIIAISGPSGTGKTTIVKTLLKYFPELAFSISATTRQMRSNEKDSIDYYFLTADDFKNKIINNELLEYQEVYHNLFYGTLKSDIFRLWNENRIPILDIDVFGALNVKKEFGNKSLIIFIHPGSIDTLRDRLINRGSESDSSFNTRIAKAEIELNEAHNFDDIVYNDKHLNDAINEVTQIVKEFIV
jgi:guanylate kinase